MKIRMISAICLLMATSGCVAPLTAYLERSTRKEAIVDNKRREYPVAGVSLDSGRRQIISSKKNGDRYTCSEPAPDTAVSKILAETLQYKSLDVKDSANLSAFTLAQRTQFIEFWRNASFQYCLLRMNGDMAGADDYLKLVAKIAPTLAEHANELNKNEKKTSDSNHATDQTPAKPEVPIEPTKPTS